MERGRPRTRRIIARVILPRCDACVYLSLSLSLSLSLASSPLPAPPVSSWPALDSPAVCTRVNICMREEASLSSHRRAERSWKEWRCPSQGGQRSAALSTRQTRRPPSDTHAKILLLEPQSLLPTSSSPPTPRLFLLLLLLLLLLRNRCRLWRLLLLLLLLRLGSPFDAFLLIFHFVSFFFFSKCVRLG